MSEKLVSFEQFIFHESKDEKIHKEILSNLDSLKKNSNGYRQEEQDRRLKELETKMDGVFKHIEITNGELGSVKADIEWLKWAVKGVIFGTGATLIITLINFLFQLLKR